MNFIKNKLVILSILFMSFANLSFAEDLVFVKADGTGKFKDISNPEDDCNGFVFREQHKKMLPNFLEPKLIKYSFSGKKLHSTLASAKKEAISSKKCIWVTTSEKAKL